MHIRIRTRTDLIFLIIPCLLPGGAAHSWVYSSWLCCAENQKFKLSCVWGAGEHAQSPFWKWKFLCSIVKEWPPISAVFLGRMTSCEPLFSGLLVLNLLFLCSEIWPYQQKDGLWEYGALVMQSHPSYFRKDNMYWKFLSRQLIVVWFSFFALLMSI